MLFAREGMNPVPPMTLLIKPASGLCNMHCKYCFYSDVTENRHIKQYGIMSEQTLETLVRKAFFYAEGSCFFGFQGGEPTLAGLDYYEKLLFYQNRYNRSGVRVLNTIQTNGYAIDENWAAFFAKNHFLVGISLDGTKEIHDVFRLDSADNGTHQKVLNAIRLFQKHGADYNILCVVTDAVAQNAKQVYQALKPHKYLQFIPCLDDLDGQAHHYSLTAKTYGEFLKLAFDEYYKDMKNGNYVSVRTFDNYVMILQGRMPEDCSMREGCGLYFVIEADGSVYPCDFYALDDYCLGNISHNSFAALAKSDNAGRFLRQSLQSDPKCAACKWHFLCKGGCRRHREPFADEKPGPNIFCESFIGFFDYAYDRLRELVSVKFKV
jgi:uncharacterized protein